LTFLRRQACEKSRDGKPAHGKVAGIFPGIVGGNQWGSIVVQNSLLALVPGKLA
jgi:hypothetical protein